MADHGLDLDRVTVLSLLPLSSSQQGKGMGGAADPDRAVVYSN